MIPTPTLPLTGRQKAQMVTDYAAHANGTNEVYRNAIGRFLYTDGVRLVAETCGAYWLLDLVGSYQHTARFLAEAFQVWHLRHDEPTDESDPTGGWVVTCWNDTPGADGSDLLCRQYIGYSDFPKELQPFRLWFENGTLMMPEER